jgi:hypothetical protein
MGLVWLVPSLIFGFSDMAEKHLIKRIPLQDYFSCLPDGKDLMFPMLGLTIMLVWDYMWACGIKKEKYPDLVVVLAFLSGIASLLTIGFMWFDGIHHKSTMLIFFGAVFVLKIGSLMSNEQFLKTSNNSSMELVKLKH